MSYMAISVALCAACIRTRACEAHEGAAKDDEQQQPPERQLLCTGAHMRPPAPARDHGRARELIDSELARDRTPSKRKRMLPAPPGPVAVSIASLRLHYFV
mmetsp:Transcript_4893/g.9728  ORF Transcript_4893/g.9728 Transcript_4893/m.9728 type:complete len:101 (+) Transcript_4893:340-642(+)